MKVKKLRVQRKLGTKNNCDCQRKTNDNARNEKVNRDRKDDENGMKL